MRIQKLTWLLNSKKCLKPKKLSLSQTLLRGASIASCILITSQTLAATAPLISDLKADLEKQQGALFEKLIQTWEKKYGATAFAPLIQIASDRKLKDTHRYVALMSATKLGGLKTIPALLPLLKDSSWMIRSGVLKILSGLGKRALEIHPTPPLMPLILPLIHDPALVVRSEAVETILALKPEGAVPALLSALEDTQNYRLGKALWVPQKALAALISLQANEAKPLLEEFLKHPVHRNDTEFRQQLQNAVTLMNQPPT